MKVRLTNIEYRKPEEVLRPLNRSDFVQELYDFLEIRLNEKFPDIHLSHNEIWQGIGQGYLSLRTGFPGNELTKADLYILDHETLLPVLELFLEPKGNKGALEGRIVISGDRGSYIEHVKDIITRFIANTPEAVLQTTPLEEKQPIPQAQFKSLSAREQFEVTAILSLVSQDLIDSIKKISPTSSIEVMRNTNKRGTARYRIYDRYKLEDGKVVDSWIAIFDSDRALDVAEIRVNHKRKFFKNTMELKAVLVQFETEDPIVTLVGDFVENYDLGLTVLKLTYSEHEKLLERLKSINPNECISAIQEAKDTVDPVILDAVVKCLDSLLVEVRAEAVKFFVNRIDMLALHSIRRGATSTAPSLRTKCEDFLSGRNSTIQTGIVNVCNFESAINDLNDFLGSKRTKAKETLLNNLDKALPLLIDTVDSNTDRRTVESCLQIISESDDPKAGEALHRSTAHKDAVIRTAALSEMAKRAQRMN